ncbi:EamA family transporter [Maribrevibacterium harenarium]|uniref:EamA family transporter n=1 Tax=Maribrevibacterium harenarium TaxID=2589817 RepID=A0A501WG74_9GAMM|nr:EamA family transporter [Maribrevibacterium harenarium]TPE48883.1 EamA family transporter [Maribrevibacterium harenarium]
MYFFFAMLPPILWGSTYAAVGLFLTDLTPFWVSVYRALPAGILLLIIFRRWPGAHIWRLMVLGVLNIGLFFICLMVAAYRIPGSVAGTLSATLPLQLLLVQWLILGRKPSSRSLIAALVGLTGVMLLLDPRFDLDMVGVVAALSATSLVVVVTLLMEHWRSDDIIGAATWQLIFGGLFLLPVAYFWEGAPTLPSLAQLPGIAWLSLMNTAFAYVMFVYAIKMVGPNMFGIFTFLNPLTAVTLGIFFLDEVLSVWQWLGVIFVLSSLLIVKLSPGAMRNLISTKLKGKKQVNS